MIDSLNLLRIPKKTTPLGLFRRLSEERVFINPCQKAPQSVPDEEKGFPGGGGGELSFSSWARPRGRESLISVPILDILPGGMLALLPVI